LVWPLSMTTSEAAASVTVVARASGMVSPISIVLGQDDRMPDQGPGPPPVRYHLHDRRYGVSGKTIHLYVRYADFFTSWRKQTALKNYINLLDETTKRPMG